MERNMSETIRSVIQASMIESTGANENRLTSSEQIRRCLMETDAPIDHLVDVLRDEVKCAICLELPIEACMTGCRHVFCKFCLDMTRLGVQKCPLCRTRFAVNPKRIEALDEVIKTVMEKSREPWLEQVKERIWTPKLVQDLDMVRGWKRLLAPLDDGFADLRDEVERLERRFAADVFDRFPCTEENVAELDDNIASLSRSFSSLQTRMDCIDDVADVQISNFWKYIDFY